METQDKQVILAVDDTPTNLEVVKGILGDDYTLQVAVNAKIAFKIIERRKPNLILLDIMMPDIDGYQMCEALKANPETSDIPVIFLTAMTNELDETRGLEIGAVDYITKPISPVILKQRVRTHLKLQAANLQLAQHNETLEQKVLERTQQLSDLQDVVMVAMGALAESRDPETGNHIRRTKKYVEILARELAKNERYASELTPDIITSIAKSAPLHDIGKVGVADCILLKPGPLTEEEFEQMKKHAFYGFEAICAAEASLGYADNFLIFAKEIAYCHHEKWDGSGYPQGLRGEDIPLSARMMALADVYDALITERVYKPAFSHEKATAIIVEGKGSHFDPILVDVFLANAERFEKIANRYRDHANDNELCKQGE
ncbi:two-component system response regulator [Vibrio taketomensis]|uniref:response regulator n=1 Tax=Vibrio taketomensis TaxID=2572923 RepID=UPI0013898E03|nr:two-component system response regulator [Vibrio taketomensis]